MMLIGRMTPLSRVFMRKSSSYQYKQGQYNQINNKVREYFYYIDHNGMLFLDDARMKNFTSCFKEVEFLLFFYKNVRRTDKEVDFCVEFPFVSYCGRERNYIRSSATPFVFNNLIDNELEYNYTSNKYTFNPASLYVGSDGRVYHEFKFRDFTFALVKSSIADLLALQFVYDEHKHPVAFKYEGGEVELDFRIQRDVDNALRSVN